MRYEHRMRVRAPLEEVAAFHKRSEALSAITPPPLGVHLEKGPAELGEGDEMAFRLRLGPLSIPWVARIEDVTPAGFTDRQLKGPFRRWVHRHGFRPIDGSSTEVTDRIEASLRLHPVYGPVGLAMWLGLPILFAYRGWRTRRELERRLAARQRS